MNSLERDVKRVRPLLGTLVSVTARGRLSAGALERSVTAAFTAIAEVERLMSRHRADSELSRLNAAAPGLWVPVSPATAAVLRAMNAMVAASGGRFDPRGTAPARGGPPVALRRGAARKAGAWTLDLGGIAKGYAVDRALAAMRRAAGPGVSGVVEAGGDLRVSGRRPAAVSIRLSPSREGLRSPTFPVASTAVATSSPAFRTHFAMPSGRALRAGPTVTVFAPRCIDADALTKVVLAGADAASARCLRRYGARALVFDRRGRLRRSLP